MNINGTKIIEDFYLNFSIENKVIICENVCLGDDGNFYKDFNMEFNMEFNLVERTEVYKNKDVNVGIGIYGI